MTVRNTKIVPYRIFFRKNHAEVYLVNSVYILACQKPLTSFPEIITFMQKVAIFASICSEEILRARRESSLLSPGLTRGIKGHLSLAVNNTN